MQARHEPEAPGVAGGADVHSIHDITHTQSEVGIGPSCRPPHAEVSERPWASEAGCADDAVVHVEPETPLDVETHEHLVGPLGLLFHGPIDLVGGHDPERLARWGDHIVHAGAIEQEPANGHRRCRWRRGSQPHGDEGCATPLRQ